MFLYTNDEATEREIKESIPFTIAPRYKSGNISFPGFLNLAEKGTLFPLVRSPLLSLLMLKLSLSLFLSQINNFDGMGNLRVTKKGIRLEGISEFLLPLYVKEIHSRKDSPLVLQSDRNVTVNARNHMGQLTGQLTVGADAVEAQCKRFEVRASEDGRVLFSADEDEITIGAEKLKVTGTEGAVFGHSVETPHIRAEPSQDLRLESPTRSLIMEAPRGVQVSAAAGDFKATCRKELHLQSTEGEIFLNADKIRLGNLPTGSLSSSSASSSNSQQTVYELCVCPNGKLYLSPAGVGSTCQASSNICLWS
ncbi:unnamed protein product [Nyctereutes procyonoides]|uniref:(raccoon dog) hypothetical protein n=1 Tax=Nyctereutes procyonoides TaxID=34880 RepID=A0A811YVG4_NYCPR|nr:unnamed protein product [Nyctereutes procyonoides]